MIQNKIENLLSRMDKCRSAGAGKWMACCPAHDDRTPSLSIKQLECGKILLHCFAGCGADEIRIALNMDWSDLCSEDWTPVNRPREPALDAAIVIIARDNISRGIELNDADMQRYKKAVRRLYGD